MQFSELVKAVHEEEALVEKHEIDYQQLSKLLRAPGADETEPLCQVRRASRMWFVVCLLDALLFIGAIFQSRGCDRSDSGDGRTKRLEHIHRADEKCETVAAPSNPCFVQQSPFFKRENAGLCWKENELLFSFDIVLGKEFLRQLGQATEAVIAIGSSCAIDQIRCVGVIWGAYFFS